jgi:hypothetical protein
MFCLTYTDALGTKRLHWYHSSGFASSTAASLITFGYSDVSLEYIAKVF